MTNERRLFASLSAIDDEVNRRLHRRLVDAANAAGLLDVAYRTIDTPVGALLLAATPMTSRSGSFELYIRRRLPTAFCPGQCLSASA